MNRRFAKITQEAWRKLDGADRHKWKDEVPQAFYGDTMTIPINFSKERISAETEGNARITTVALMVSTPKQYAPLLRTLLDSAILARKITNLIPLAFQREDPKGYYHLIATQERFMDNHRNIPIMSVPSNASTRPGIKGQTLEQVLNGNKDIQRVSYDPKAERYHVSIQAKKYKEVHNWINQVIKDHHFPFRPSIRSMKYNNKGSSVAYSAIFADAVSVASESYDASTIKTTRSNAWRQHPPLDISYTPTAEAFPPLPKKDVSPATPSTMSETVDEDTIQSAISAAIRTLQDQHKSEIE